MLKYIKHHMESIAGIEIYPLISLMIFFIFFVCLIIYVVKADKKKLDDYSNIPLDTDHHDK